MHFAMAREWRQKYGPVVGFLTASRNVVAVCGPHEVLEVLHREEFQARTVNKFFYDRSFGKRLGNGTFPLFILTSANIYVSTFGDTNLQTPSLGVIWHFNPITSSRHTALRNIASNM
jgi:hypothetical protein